MLPPRSCRRPGKRDCVVLCALRRTQYPPPPPAVPYPLCYKNHPCRHNKQHRALYLSYRPHLQEPALVLRERLGLVVGDLEVHRHRRGGRDSSQAPRVRSPLSFRTSNERAKRLREGGYGRGFRAVGVAPTGHPHRHQPAASQTKTTKNASQKSQHHRAGRFVEGRVKPKVGAKPKSSQANANKTEQNKKNTFPGIRTDGLAKKHATPS